MSAVLQLNNISKNYGAIRAVDNLSLTIEAGNVYGILGPNGSGKTTTLGIILGVLQPNSGNFSWFGEPASRFARRQIGSILETPNFYPYLGGYTNLQIACDIKRVPQSDIDRVMNIVNLSQRMKSKFREYSYGMKQRLALASALLGDPQVLVLDEPTNGLDPQGIAEVREIITRQAQQGKTIIMASHMLDEVEKICTHVAILRTGRLLASGTIESVLSQEDQIMVKSAEMDLLKVALNDQPGVTSCKQSGDYFAITLKEGFDTGDLNKYLFESGVVLTECKVIKSSLEAKFLEVVKQ